MHRLLISEYWMMICSFRQECISGFKDCNDVMSDPIALLYPTTFQITNIMPDPSLCPKPLSLLYN